MTKHVHAATAEADDCVVLFADTAELKEKVYRLRYQVYCLEHQYEAGEDGLEFDEYDASSRHMLLMHRPSGEAIGTVRIVLPQRQGGLSSLPMAQACGTDVLQSLPAETTAEISRFAISKRRRMSCNAGGMVRLALMRGLYYVSLDLGLTHWCAIMEPTLQRLLRFHGINFQSLGPMVDFHGLRQPVKCTISEAFDHVRIKQPEVWHWARNRGAHSIQHTSMFA